MKARSCLEYMVLPLSNYPGINVFGPQYFNELITGKILCIEDRNEILRCLFSQTIGHCFSIRLKGFLQLLHPLFHFPFVSEKAFRTLGRRHKADRFLSRSGEDTV